MFHFLKGCRASFSVMINILNFLIIGFPKRSFFTKVFPGKEKMGHSTGEILCVGLLPGRDNAFVSQNRRAINLFVAKIREW